MIGIKVASFDAGEARRRSTSSLGCHEMTRHLSIFALALR